MPGLTKHRRRRSTPRSGHRAIAALIALAALAAIASPTLAARPTREVIDIGTPDIEVLISEHLSATCGFEILVDANATVAIMVFSNNDGTFRREIDAAEIKWTLTNVATGVSIDIHNVGPDISWVNRDGVTMFASIGRAYVAHDGIGFVGRSLINVDTGEVLAFGGRFTGDISQVVCAPLAS